MVLADAADLVLVFTMPRSGVPDGGRRVRWELKAGDGDSDGAVDLAANAHRFEGAGLNDDCLRVCGGADRGEFSLP
jgi:hypothetical protein